jgi:hypothetical protein
MVQGRSCDKGVLARRTRKERRGKRWQASSGLRAPRERSGTGGETRFEQGELARQNGMDDSKIAYEVTEERTHEG